MTYRDLLRFLSQLSSEQLDLEVMVSDGAEIQNVNRTKFLRDGDFPHLENDYPVLRTN